MTAPEGITLRMDVTLRDRTFRQSESIVASRLIDEVHKVSQDHQDNEHPDNPALISARRSHQPLHSPPERLESHWWSFLRNRYCFRARVVMAVGSSPSSVEEPDIPGSTAGRDRPEFQAIDLPFRAL